MDGGTAQPLHHTVLSYRDTWRLFLRFASQQKGRPVARLVLADLDATSILAFLKHCEGERNVSVGTRNCRLAALRSFFGYVAQQEPLAAAQRRDPTHSDQACREARDELPR